MTCDHARCYETATVALRFGDGLVRMPGMPPKRQSYAIYCDPHAGDVQGLFNTCDVGHVSRVKGGVPRRAGGWEGATAAA